MKRLLMHHVMRSLKERHCQCPVATTLNFETEAHHWLHGANESCAFVGESMESTCEISPPTKRQQQHTCPVDAKDAHTLLWPEQ
jgi:hypothetical protein